MTFGSKTLLGAVSTAAAWSLAVALVSGQAAPAQAPAAPAAAQPGQPLLAEQVFKNIQVLRGTTVQEFMGIMGAYSAALGMSCEDCHNADDRNWDGFAAENPRKQMARMMTLMTQNINRQNFGGRQMVTCYACHRGDSRPNQTPSMADIYGGFPPDNPPDIITQEPGQPTADAVFEKYLAALGGAARAASLKSWSAKANRIGYGPEGFPVAAEVYNVAPNRQTILIHTMSGDATYATDGTSAWYAAPYRPVPVLQLTGKDFDGARIDAMLAFPAEIKNVAANWRVGRPRFMNEKEMTHVQGTTQNGVTVSLFFDPDTNLLVRQERFIESPVGRIPHEVNYADYKEVAGVKLPHKIEMLGINGRETIELTEVQANATIPPQRFNRPAPPAAVVEQPAPR
jgi:photosynthetic reaction center cytochrome c subunit